VQRLRARCIGRPGLGTLPRRAVVPPPSAWLSETYRETERRLEVLSSIRDGEPSHLIAIPVRAAIEACDFDIDILAPPTGAANGEDDDDELVMLVGDIELVKRGERMVRWQLPLIGLYRIEALPNLPPNTGRDLWKLALLGLTTHITHARPGFAHWPRQPVERSTTVRS
jgi:hypothetical protein